ncbi:MAG: hypothetical protein ABEJ95_04840 [Candidatus Nanohalobium sp.]
MNDEDIKKYCDWIEKEYLNMFGDLLQRTRMRVYTHPSQIRDLLDNPEFQYKENARDILEEVENNPDRGRGFNFPTEGFSVLYFPEAKNIEQMAEEIFHAMSGLEAYTEETFVPLPTYLICLRAKEKGVLNASLKEIVEDCIGTGEFTENRYKFPKDQVPENYRGRETTAALLEHLTTSGPQIDTQKQIELARNIYEMILRGENAEEAIKKELQMLKNPKKSRNKSLIDKIKNVF